MNTAKILDGKSSAEALRAEILREVELLKSGGIQPGLAVILVGDDPGSVSYVKGKEQACRDLGMRDFFHRFPADYTEKELLALIAKLNADPEVDGILVQLPLPPHFNEKRVTNSINPEKDVDGLHPVNVGRLLLGEDGFVSCTPNGVIKMLEFYGIPTRGKHVVVVGRSNLVGKPVAALLLKKGEFADATVTVCHSRTPDLAYHTRQADILIAAIGRAKLISPDMIKEGAVVIDVGVNRVEDSSRKSGYRLVGDVDFDGALGRASAISPVPGGVGPMTITMLMYNTLKSAKERKLKANA